LDLNLFLSSKIEKVSGCKLKTKFTRARRRLILHLAHISTGLKKQNKKKNSIRTIEEVKIKKKKKNFKQI